MSVSACKVQHFTQRKQFSVDVTLRKSATSTSLHLTLSPNHHYHTFTLDPLHYYNPTILVGCYSSLYSFLQHYTLLNYSIIHCNNPTTLHCTVLNCSLIRYNNYQNVLNCSALHCTTSITTLSKSHLVLDRQNPEW